MYTLAYVIKIKTITKKFEETITGSVAEVLTYFSKKSIKGEFVIVIEGRK